MEFEKVKTVMNTRGYDLHSYTPDRISSDWSKFVDPDGRALIKLHEEGFWVHCTVTIENKVASFELTYIAQRWGFVFRSGKMGPLTREDFSLIERHFIFYASRLYKRDPFDVIPK